MRLPIALIAPAPSAPEAEALARTYWGKNIVRADAGAQEALASVTRLLIRTAEIYDGVQRNQRPNESVFWHQFRVGDSLYSRHQHLPPREQLLVTFLGVAHDLCEDTRKLFKPHPAYKPEEIADFWQGTAAEKQLITDVLKLKTDPENLEGDARRAAQHRLVTEVRDGKHGEAGKLYAVTMTADKFDNLHADLQDFKAGRMSFRSRQDVLEYVFKKIADDQIVEQLPIAAGIKEAFHRTFDAVLEQVILGKVLPSGDSIQATSDQRRAKRLGRTIKARDNPTTSGTAYHQFRAARQALTLRNRSAALHNGRLSFASRQAGLEHALNLATDFLIARVAPISPETRTKFGNAYDRVMTQLLYAGSIKPTIITDQPAKPAEQRPAPPAAAGSHKPHPAPAHN